MRVKAFLLGMREFRRIITSSPAELEAYDWGREFAHRLTLRRYEP